jgi:hypothetical protein
VELRVFTGRSIDETADVLGISPATVSREWTNGPCLDPPRAVAERVTKR